MPMRIRVAQGDKKSKSFKDLFRYYQPLIEEKNKFYKQSGLLPNIFNDADFTTEVKTMQKDGSENVNKWVKPFEMRMFDLKKQSYTIQLTSKEQNALRDYEAQYHINKSIFPSRSMQQLTVSGPHRQHRDIVAPSPDPENQVGGLVAKKLEHHYDVSQLLANRRARLAKH